MGGGGVCERRPHVSKESAQTLPAALGPREGLSTADATWTFAEEGATRPSEDDVHGRELCGDRHRVVAARVLDKKGRERRVESARVRDDSHRRPRALREDARRRGKMVVLDRQKLAQWDKMKQRVMEELWEQKFSRPEFREILRLTGRAQLFHFLGMSGKVERWVALEEIRERT